MPKTAPKGSDQPLPKIEINLDITPEQGDVLLKTLQARFEKNTGRHEGIPWASVQERLAAQPGKLASLHVMESTGGEPDVAGIDEKTGQFLFYDCAAQSPEGRRSLCYDPAALASRKKFKPAHSAMGMAAEMGIELPDEEAYRALQWLGPFDTKTSSWLKTPAGVRNLGGALFGDFRYGRVFVYHNGAESYYGSRGFRGLLRV